MTKGEYPYPPDEFDAVDPSAGPRGVHRNPRSRWATVWPFLAALVVAAALGLVVVNLVWDEREPAPSAQGTAEAPAGDGTVTEGATPETPAADPTGTPAPVEPTTPAPEPTPEPTPEPPPPAPEPDLATPVSVFNSTSVTGLAADAAEQLEDAGWTEVEAANYTGGTLPSSTVSYAGPELEVSARAVAAVLGITTVQLAESDAVDGIQVVLERDFAR
ncbi:LytR C-terminal domain-containing protein [uncultured Cellulomonas sp.]|uniref:LytR C-terminal domain-containing protein n=1 Tax=uncultured Cellulomonas sp. TaxID=189682 RepID=UPI00261B17DD|nr:LytR C-terminal domain-containing protein [uncultured Cellulomonas sp.]